MQEAIARINEAITDLNNCISKVTSVDDVEFDLESRLNVLEVAVDDLGSDIDSTLELVGQTSE